MRGLVRMVSGGFPEATVQGERPRIHLARARRQHEAYVAALEARGVRVRRLPPHPILADSCFVEDQAVVAKGVALLARSGHPGRRAEAEAVGAALARHVAVEVMRAPATLDGGDVLRVGERLFVGRSGRTNDHGIAALRQVFGPRGLTVVPVDLPEGLLHLKCVASSLGDRGVLLARGSIPAALFGGVPVHLVPSDEAYAANVVRAGPCVLVAAGYPGAAAAVARAGLVPVPVEVSEIRAADGSLTCLSILY